LIKNGEFEGLIKSCGLSRQDAYFLAKKNGGFSLQGFSMVDEFSLGGHMLTVKSGEFPLGVM